MSGWPSTLVASPGEVSALCAERGGTCVSRRLAPIRIRGEGWEVLQGRAHGGSSIAACKAIMLKSGAILGDFDRRWRRRGSEEEPETYLDNGGREMLSRGRFRLNKPAQNSISP